MRHIRLLALLLAAATNAAAGVISLEVPLSPSPSGIPSAALNSPLAKTFPLALSPWTPSLSGALAAPAIPANAIPIIALQTAGKRPVMPVPLPPMPKALAAQAYRLAHRASVARPAKVIDSLRAHGAESEKIAALDGENGKLALERNFMSAASLGDGVPGDDGKTVSGDGAKLTPKSDARPLLERMLERVRLDDRGRPDEKKALADAFQRMLRTPTGRRYAEEFLAEGIDAVVHFEDFPDSQLFLVDGRKRFYAAQAYTDWRQEGYAEIRLNRHYVDGDPDYLRESLPAVLGHELLGHGLWYGRAAKEDLYLAFHYHELNETHARVVGWSIDHELDGRIEENGVWTYLSDPANYLKDLKKRLPYYAVTFSHEEMADAIGSMKKRLVDARADLLNSVQNAATQRTWLPVLEHFSKGHGYDSKRFTLLRKEMNDLVAHYDNDVANAEAIVREVSGLIERMEAEPELDSQRYLALASQNPFFARLGAEVTRATEALKDDIAKAMPPGAVGAPFGAARPADQYTWQQLSEMYRKDLLEDAKRPAGKKHWAH